MCRSRRTLKNAVASDWDDIGVQFSIGRRTLLVATRRLKDGVPSRNVTRQQLLTISNGNLSAKVFGENFFWRPSGKKKAQSPSFSLKRYKPPTRIFPSQLMGKTYLYWQRNFTIYLRLNSWSFLLFRGSELKVPILAFTYLYQGEGVGEAPAFLRWNKTNAWLVTALLFTVTFTPWWVPPCTDTYQHISVQRSPHIPPVNT